jgi:hypothetical protein
MKMVVEFSIPFRSLSLNLFAFPKRRWTILVLEDPQVDYRCWPQEEWNLTATLGQALMDLTPWNRILKT